MADRWTGILLFLSAIVMGILSWQLPIGKLTRPGPGLYPLILACILGFLSLLLLAQSFRAGPASGGDRTPGRSGKKIIYVLAILLIYAFSFPALGYLFSTFLFLLLLKPVLEKKWSFVVPGAIVVTLATYLIFDVFLQAQLPKGIWGN